MVSLHYFFLIFIDFKLILLLFRAENEKQTVSEELNRLEKKRIENETTLQEQKNRNQSLREMFEKEKKKVSNAVNC